jgi:inorganic triphosphatase YgiF
MGRKCGMRLEDNFEVELKLSVTGDNPDALLDEVAELRQLGSVRLSPGAGHRLRDIYWDFPDGGLRSRKLSLRLRQIDDRQVFTVKGNTSSSEGLFRRYELEIPATPENWHEIQAVLAGEGVVFGQEGGGETPDDWLRGTGLRPTQDRETHRSILFAYANDDGDRPVAELALDRTHFNFGRVLIDYWEIEIEQIGQGDDTLPRELGRALLSLYPDRLEPSTMGKYSRGLALERELRASGQL